jgi:hypothetical protein
LIGRALLCARTREACDASVPRAEAMIRTMRKAATRAAGQKQEGRIVMLWA